MLKRWRAYSHWQAAFVCLINGARSNVLQIDWRISIFNFTTLHIPVVHIVSTVDESDVYPMHYCTTSTGSTSSMTPATMTAARSNIPITTITEVCTLPVVCLKTANFDLNIGDVIKNKNTIIGVCSVYWFVAHNVLVIHSTSNSCSLFWLYVLSSQRLLKRSLDDTMHSMPGCFGYPKSIHYDHKRRRRRGDACRKKHTVYKHMLW
jgi:hypothetical protein